MKKDKPIFIKPNNLDVVEKPENKKEKVNTVYEIKYQQENTELLINNQKLKQELLENIKLLVKQLEVISSNQISTNTNLKSLSHLILKKEEIKLEVTEPELNESKIKQVIYYILINLVIVLVMSLAIMHVGTLLDYTTTAKLIQYVVGLSLFYAYGYILYNANNYKDILNKLFKQRNN